MAGRSGATGVRSAVWWRAANYVAEGRGLGDEPDSKPFSLAPGISSELGGFVTRAEVSGAVPPATCTGKQAGASVFVGMNCGRGACG